MPRHGIPFWKKAPFVRLLIPLVGGIILQWNFQLNAATWFLIFGISFLLIAGYFFIPFFNRFRFGFISGIAAGMLFLSIGALLAWHKDIRHNRNWLGHKLKVDHVLLAVLDEPLVEKTRSYKAIASARFILDNGKPVAAEGKIILYFKKDSVPPSLSQGSQIIINKPLQLIKNSGNPGGFDYKRYSLFHGVTHQVFLSAEDYILLDNKNITWLNRFIYRSRENILAILRSAISSEKELGLAEALLIGYKDDLDRNLVQSYTNTGVVHIIAISGLHLGLIYWLLVQCCRPLKKRLRWLRPVLIILGLWLFALLAGAQPSVLRSALMFTCIILGENLTRKTSIYNTLALSAFLLLCYNPYWLWDLGFQLSYAAVLSIVIFMQPVYNWFYISNRFLDMVWKLNAVTIAAQILTLPLSIYYFHQFPNYFLLTNLVAVPLSSLILLCEILLCLLAVFPGIALQTGKFISWLIRLMNTWVEKLEGMPFSVWEGLQISTSQALFLYIVILGIGLGLLERSAVGVKCGFIALLAFVTLRSLSFIETSRQQKIIVYNISGHSAIEFIEGNKYFLKADPELQADMNAINFHLKPSRIKYRVSPAETLHDLYVNKNYTSYRGRHIFQLGGALAVNDTLQKPVIDILIVSGKSEFALRQLGSCLLIRKIIFDGSVPFRKLKAWKKDCDDLYIPYHELNEDGAFVMNLR